jgi:hypothetical protein
MQQKCCITSMPYATSPCQELALVRLQSNLESWVSSSAATLFYLKGRSHLEIACPETLARDLGPRLPQLVAV